MELPSPAKSIESLRVEKSEGKGYQALPFAYRPSIEPVRRKGSSGMGDQLMLAENGIAGGQIAAMGSQNARCL